MRREKGFTLVEIVIVIAIIGVLAAVTVVALKPQEIFANGRNSRRTNDVASLNSAIGQWLSREGLETTTPYEDLLGVASLAATDVLDPSDGVGDTEGHPAADLAVLTLEGYLQNLPTDPIGQTYRIGVDSAASPTHVLVCTNDIENTSTYPTGAGETYAGGVFCQSN
jgi:prepilin-type N-terminal cleavage/methylation domain-containing protein